MRSTRLPAGYLPTVLAFVAFVAFLGLTASASAWSKAADYLVAQQIGEACEGGKGQIDPAYVIERDLTGDGRPDLIVNHDGITCADGSRSRYCGAAACSFHVYVRKGKLLEPADEGLGAEVAVSAGDPPTIFFFSNDGTTQSIRWNGKSFE